MKVFYVDGTQSASDVAAVAVDVGAQNAVSCVPKADRLKLRDLKQSEFHALGPAFQPAEHRSFSLGSCPLILTMQLGLSFTVFPNGEYQKGDFADDQADLDADEAIRPFLSARYCFARSQEHEWDLGSFDGNCRVRYRDPFRNVTAPASAHELTNIKTHQPVDPASEVQSRCAGQLNKHQEFCPMLLFDLPTRYRCVRWAPLPLRLIVGFGFIEHGFAKLSKGPDAFAAILHAMGVPAPHLMAWVTILTEIGGGFAVFLGGLVTLVAVPMAAVLLVAVFTVHLPYGFSSIKLINVTAAGAQFGPPGYECDLLYLACLASLVMTGPGPLALDEFIGAARHKVDARADAQLTANA